jgi:hypothetical protein
VPSRLPEALGRVAIEAMAHRRPPLVARIGGLPEIVEDRVSGWIVAPNDAPALAHTLSEAVTKPEEWKGYGAAARARFETTFAAPAIARQFQESCAPRLTAKAEARPRAIWRGCSDARHPPPDPQLHPLARRRRHPERLSFRAEPDPDPAVQCV